MAIRRAEYRFLPHISIFYVSFFGLGDLSEVWCDYSIVGFDTDFYRICTPIFLELSLFYECIFIFIILARRNYSDVRSALPTEYIVRRSVGKKFVSAIADFHCSHYYLTDFFGNL